MAGRDQPGGPPEIGDRVPCSNGRAESEANPRGEGELQDTRPEKPIQLERVGFRGLRARRVFDTAEGPIPLDLVIDAYVEIGGDRRGAHLSRNIDALTDAVLLTGPSRSIEDFLDKAAQSLLRRHPYSRRAMVKASTVYYVDLEWRGIRGREPVSVSISVSRDREGRRTWTVQVEVKAMSVCPSAMETISRKTGGQGPWPSHAQKVIVRGSVTTEGVMIRIEDIAKAIASSGSAPVFTRLKREEEARLVLSAFENPKLVEDVARSAVCNLYRVVRRAGRAAISVEVESLESIHPHNVYASRSATTDQLSEEAGLVCD